MTKNQNADNVITKMIRFALNIVVRNMDGTDIREWSIRWMIKHDGFLYSKECKGEKDS